MTQIYEKVIVKKSKKIEEADEILGDLNPKYYEEAINLEEAKERSIASDIYAGSKYNFFSSF